MINERENIDNLFAGGLKNYKAKAPVHAWDRLSNELDRKQGIKKLFFLRLMAASVAILLAFGAGYFYAGYNKQTPLIVNQEMTIPAESEQQNSNPYQIQDDNQDGGLKDTESAIEMAYEFPEKGEPIPGSSNSGKNTILYSKIPEIEKADETTSLSLFSRNEIRVNTMEIVHTGKIAVSHSKFDESLATKSPSSVPALNIPEYKGVEYTYGDYSGKKEPIEHRWSVGALVAPTYSYREISANYENQGQMDPATNAYLNANEEALLSYAGGVNVDYALNKKWGLQSGMYYSRIGQVNNDALEYTYFGKDGYLLAIHTSTGNISISIENIPDHILVTNIAKDSASNGSPTVSIEQNFDFFEVPFLLKYKMINRKFSFNLTGGLSPAYMVKNSTYLNVDDEKYNVGNAENLNSLLINTSIGLGLEYKVFKQLSFSLEPTFKYSMVSLNKDSQFYYHPYYLSLFTGVKFRF